MIIDRIKFFYQINWFKTLHINFKLLSFNDAKKIPIVIFGKCYIQSLKGTIKFESPITFGMLGLGQRYEVFRKESGIAELNLQGKIILKGKAQIGYDYKIYVANNAELILGNMSSIASNAKLICVKKIILGNFCRLGSECQLIDTNFHDLKNTQTQEILNRNNEIILGSYNFISNRVTIMGKTVTSDYFTIASNSLCNKDYSKYGNNVLIGGIPAKLLRDNITRDWESEKKDLETYLTIKL